MKRLSLFLAVSLALHLALQLAPNIFLREPDVQLQAQITPISLQTMVMNSDQPVEEEPVDEPIEPVEPEPLEEETDDPEPINEPEPVPEPVEEPEEQAGELEPEELIEQPEPEPVDFPEPRTPEPAPEPEQIEHPDPVETFQEPDEPVVDQPPPREMVQKDVPTVPEVVPPTEDPTELEPEETETETHEPEEKETQGEETIDNPDQTAGLEETPGWKQTNPEYRHNPSPEYPRQAILREIEGTVELFVEIDRDGQVRSVELETSSGSRLLDDAAKEAVTNWEFEPRTENGTTTSSWAIVPVRFQLN